MSWKFWKKRKSAEKPLKIPESLHEELIPIAHEISRLHDSAKWSSQTQFEQMKLWRSLNLLFGVPAAVLAAVAGGTSLSSDGSDHIVLGVTALASAGFGAALTTLNPSRRVAQSQSSANAFLEIQTAARQLLLVKLALMSKDEALEQLDILTNRRDDANKTSDPPSTYAYWRSSRNISKRGGQNYAVDEEHNA